MILTKQEEIQLNALAHGAGAEALEILAELLWKYYSKEAVFCTPDQKNLNSGKAQLADWLKTLPKGLRDGHNGSDRQ